MKILNIVRLSALYFLALFLQTGCNSEASSERYVETGQTAAATTLDKGHHWSRSNWVGVWKGQANSFVRIDQGPASNLYRLTLQLANGPAQVVAKSAGGRLMFVQEGQQLSIVPGTGVATHLAGFEAKRDCILLQSGQGFCRD